MRVALLTREYPPEVYGGAGVHVEYLARELRRLIDVEVHCFGNPRDEPGVIAHLPNPTLLEVGANAALLTMSTDLSMAARDRRRRPRALAHLVRELRRPRVEAAARRRRTS